MNVVDSIVKPLLRQNGVWLVKRNGRVTGVDFIGDLKSLVPCPATLLDVGANIGQSIEFFASIWPSLRIFSVEPDPTNFKTIRSIKRKNMAGLVNVGFGETDSLLDFQQFEMHSLNSFLGPSTADSSPLKHQPKGVPIQVRVVKPSSEYLHSVFGTAQMDIIKIDTQGYELPILRGFDKEVLISAKVLILEANYDSLYEGQTSVSDLHAFCSDLGFNYVSSYEITRNASGGISWATCVYINKR
jgi:FkbM family methyltransferase